MSFLGRTFCILYFCGVFYLCSFSAVESRPVRHRSIARFNAKRQMDGRPFCRIFLFSVSSLAGYTSPHTSRGVGGREGSWVSRFLVGPPSNLTRTDSFFLYDFDQLGFLAGVDVVLSFCCCTACTCTYTWYSVNITGGHS